MPTKEHKRRARGLVEALESRVHSGPLVSAAEIRGARTFLEQHDFSPASDYFNRLTRLQDCLRGRSAPILHAKRNYGGETPGGWLQVQSIYDHVILSACYGGEFNGRKGRIKLSHRFNQAGRIDFVELKFLRSLQPCLDGGLRKLVTVENYPGLGRDWLEAEAHALRVLPQELIFVHPEAFRYPRTEVLAWLINLGHRAAADLLGDLQANRVNGQLSEAAEAMAQLHLTSMPADPVAMPILEQAARLEATVECDQPEAELVRYVRR